MGTTLRGYMGVYIWDDWDTELEYPYIIVNEKEALFFYSPDRAAVRINLEQYGTPVLRHIGKRVNVTLTFELNAITESKVSDYDRT